ncbi:MAG: alpha/beta hydrolase [Oleispira sp.]|nr:alpha/beta hydrolase [Oleispira sp.]
MITFLVVVGVLVALGVLVTLMGIRIRNNGMRPIVQSQVDADWQRLAITKDGRQVAYCTYGSQDVTASVVINMHGSGLEAGFERTTYEKICTALGCRGIAISLPGCGFTDEKPGRQVRDWPAEDLAAVLEAEGISQFHITGHSQGTPHAMAAALHFSDRCIGLGLNAPLIPTALCEELNIDSTLGTGQTPTSAQLKQASMGWYFTLMGMAFGVLPPSLLSSLIKKGFPKVKADHELVSRFEGSMRRAVVRGTSGATWETAQDTCFEWGFDVRDIQHANAFVWHSDDDSAIPCAQGKWLAEHFGADYRHASEGYGHMTYCTGQYQDPEKSLVAALLRGANQIG